MEDCHDYSLSGLEKCNYRYLQKKAKSMSLPSNVKKVYLIQLIHTKMIGTPGQMESIIEQVRRERQQLANRRRGRNKRKRLQNTEISSTSLHNDFKMRSPPISVTPKRHCPAIIPYSPNQRRSFNKFKPNIPINESPLRTYQNKKPDCNMVLRNRSYPKMYNEPSSMVSLLRPNVSPEKKPKDLRIMVQRRPSMMALFAGSPQSVKNVHVQTALCMVRARPVIPALSAAMELTPSPTPSKRHRALSGVYPIHAAEPKAVTYEYVQSDVGIRNRDGTFSKINALVQRPINSKPLHVENNDLEFTISDIIHSACDVSTQSIQPKLTENNNYIPYQTQKSLTPTQNTFVASNSSAFLDTPMSISGSSEINFTEYCHKKIRAEQVRTRRESGWKRDRGEGSLPRIHEVFTNFSYVAKDADQPIYVQVKDASVRTSVPPAQPVTSAPTLRLEALYNIQLPAKVATAPNNTHTVYSTPVLPTPMEYNAPTAYNAQFKIASCEQVDFQANNIYNYMMLSDAEPELANRRDMSSPLSQLASQVGDIPEMVEDALELISQDGDYMERIGMGARAGCLLCEWEGPASLLDHHVRKEHQSRIHKLSSQEWNITYRLGDVTRAPHAELLQSVSGALFALTAHYRDPDCFMCEIQSLSLDLEAPSTCSLTVYHRVTGEPFSWTGVIPHVTMASEPGLRIKLSSLELLPNNARLQLLNRELVGDGLGNVVFGQPELDDIHVIVFVKI